MKFELFRQSFSVLIGSCFLVVSSRVLKATLYRPVIFPAVCLCIGQVSTQRSAVQVPASSSAPQGDPATERSTEPDLQESGATDRVTAGARLRASSSTSETLVSINRTTCTEMCKL